MRQRNYITIRHDHLFIRHYDNHPVPTAVTPSAQEPNAHDATQEEIVLPGNCAGDFTFPVRGKRTGAFGSVNNNETVLAFQDSNRS